MGGSENWAPTPNSKREMVLPSAEKNFRTIIMKEKTWWFGLPALLVLFSFSESQKISFEELGEEL